MELFDFVLFGKLFQGSGKITTVPGLFFSQKWEQTSDYECTYQVELFDTHFVFFVHVLAFSGMKLLVKLLNHSRTYFKNTYSKMET